ncbi:MAG: hypothetical protein HYZ48_01630 [Chlamydiales bacterium]|nr:hypothetical protein [Chlamydiales bacterium]
MRAWGIRPLLFLAVSSPFFLFAASMALFFHEKGDLWPFALLAAIGLLSIYSLYRIGFYSSLAALLLVAGLQHPIWIEKPFYCLFLAGIAASWIIALLSQEEIAEWLNREKKIKDTQSIPLEIPEEKEEDLKASLQLKILEKKHRDLEVLFQQKEEQLQSARKDFFQIEGKNFLLQKEQIESSLIDEQMSIHQGHIQEILGLCEELEFQVKTQEEIITSLALKKKMARKPKTLSERIKTKQYSLLE